MMYCLIGKILLIQPSSAAAERVFSLLNNYVIQYQTIPLARRLHRMLTAPSIQQALILILNLILS